LASTHLGLCVRSLTTLRANNEANKPAPLKSMSKSKKRSKNHQRKRERRRKEKMLKLGLMGFIAQSKPYHKTHNKDNYKTVNGGTLTQEEFDKFLKEGFGSFKEGDILPMTPEEF